MRFKKKVQKFIVSVLDVFLDWLEKIQEWVLNKSPSGFSEKIHLRIRYRDDRLRFENAACLKSGGIYKKGLNASAENLSALITMEYHRIEKGLALPNRRAGASQDVIPRLIFAIEEQWNRFGYRDEAHIGLRVIGLYFKETPVNFLNLETKKVIPIYENLLEKYEKINIKELSGGFFLKSPSDIVDLKKIPAKKFFKTRHSIRDFDQRDVSEGLICELAEIALTSPSVCNRQAWKLFAITDRVLISEILVQQNGNRGFSDRIPLLFVVASDQSCFVSAEERNQCWIDGGLFSMTLMLAIHSNGLGSCPLNWCVPKENDLRVREIIQLPKNLSINMFIAAGHLPQSFKVACSTRKPVNAVLKIIR